MKKITVNRITFDEIFHYAKKHFGISWNASNDLFFGNTFEYLQIDEVELDMLFDDTDYTEDTIMAATKEEILNIDNNYHKSNLITARFMIDNNISEMEVDSK